jgi:aspartyl-tRNA synthetase
MQEVTEHFRRFRLQGLRRHDRQQPEGEVWAIPAKTGGSRAFCDRMNSWAQGQGQPGLGYIFWRKERRQGRGRRPDRQEHRSRSVPKPFACSWVWKPGDACFFAAGDPAKFAKLCRRRARARRRGTEPDRPATASNSLDRRFPVLRMGRGRQEGRFRPQPVLDAAGRPWMRLKTRIR